MQDADLGLPIEELGNFVPSNPVPISLPVERLDERGNGIGTCRSCRKVRQLWANICGWCGEGCS